MLFLKLITSLSVYFYLFVGILDFCKQDICASSSNWQLIQRLCKAYISPPMLKTRKYASPTYPKQSARKQSSLESMLNTLFFKADFYVYDNVILLTCHPFLVWSMASCRAAQASLHNPQHRTRISNSVQLLWRNRHFCGNSRANNMD